MVIVEYRYGAFASEFMVCRVPALISAAPTQVVIDAGGAVEALAAANRSLSASVAPVTPEQGGQLTAKMVNHG